MAIVYVAGPITTQFEKQSVISKIRFGDSRRALDRCYQGIQQAARSLETKILLPDYDRELDHSDSRSFFEEISHRICNSDAVIFVLAPGDMSGPAESAIASISGKRQLILALRGTDVPRILRGLPGVVSVIEFDEREVPISRIIEFLRELPGPSQGISTVSSV